MNHQPTAETLHHDAATTTGEQIDGVERVCPPLRLLLIAAISLGFGGATNHWINASSNESYVGQMQVETMTVRAPVDGILQAWYVAEGETIDPDVLICQIGGHNLTRQIQTQERELARLNARLETQQAQVDVKLHEHLRDLESDIYQAELQTAELLQQQYYHQLEAMAWRDTLEKMEQTAQKKSEISPLGQFTIQKIQPETTISDVQINAMLKEEAANNSLDTIKAQLKICNQRLSKLQSQKQKMQQQVRLAVGMSEIELQRDQAEHELELLREQAEQQNVRSTTVGTVASFRRRPGEYVQAGEVLAEMFQLSENYVVADIPSSLSHRFEVESTVKCKFPSGEMRTGVVTNVAVATSPVSNRETQTGPTVPLRIEPTGALWPKMPVGGQVTIVR